MPAIYSQQSFIEENLYWLIPVIAVGIVVLLAFVVFMIRLSRTTKKKKKKVEPIELHDKSEYLDCLGGEANIVSHTLKGSRITIEVNDIDKITPEKLLEAGVSSYIKMANKLVLVVKDHASEVYDRIFR